MHNIINNRLFIDSTQRIQQTKITNSGSFVEAHMFTSHAKTTNSSFPTID